MTRHTGRWIAAALATSVFAGAAILAVDAATTSCGEFQFDAAAWRADGRDGHKGRRDAAELLHRCKTLRGRSQAEVSELLGRPEYSRKRSPWSYAAGDDGSGLGDADYLVIHFDRRGRVARTEW